MGQLKSMAVNTHAQSCLDGEEEQMPCCKDVSEELKVEEVTTVAFDFNSNPDSLELAIVNHFLHRNNDFTLKQEKPHFKYYSPPLPDRDIPVLFQSFLI